MWPEAALQTNQCASLARTLRAKGCHVLFYFVYPLIFWEETLSLARWVRSCSTLHSFSPHICEHMWNNSRPTQSKKPTFKKQQYAKKKYLFRNKWMNKKRGDKHPCSLSWHALNSKRKWKLLTFLLRGILPGEKKVSFLRGWLSGDSTFWFCSLVQLHCFRPLFVSETWR